MKNSSLTTRAAWLLRKRKDNACIVSSQWILCTRLPCHPFYTFLSFNYKYHPHNQFTFSILNLADESFTSNFKYYQLQINYIYKCLVSRCFDFNQFKYKILCSWINIRLYQKLWLQINTQLLWQNEFVANGQNIFTRSNVIFSISSLKQAELTCVEIEKRSTYYFFVPRRCLCESLKGP